VYDGELEGQMTMLFDTNKRLIKVNDIYPEDVQLGKGNYTIRAQLRHDNRGVSQHSHLEVMTSRKISHSFESCCYLQLQAVPR